MIAIQLCSKQRPYFLVWLSIILMTGCRAVLPVQYVIKKKSYELDHRVQRWQTDRIDEIKSFLDQSVNQYADLTNEALWLQRAFHYLPGIIDLLNGPYGRNYFRETRNGMYTGASASLLLLYKQKDKPKEVYVLGKIEIAMHRGNRKTIIHHMMFRPKQNSPSLKVPYMSVLQEKYNTSDVPSPYKEAKKSNKIPQNQVKKTSKSMLVDKPYRAIFDKRNKMYIISYIPSKLSPHKLIKVIIHEKESFEKD